MRASECATRTVRAPPPPSHTVGRAHTRTHTHTRFIRCERTHTQSGCTDSAGRANARTDAHTRAGHSTAAQRRAQCQWSGGRAAALQARARTTRARRPFVGDTSINGHAVRGPWGHGPAARRNSPRANHRPEAQSKIGPSLGYLPGRNRTSGARNASGGGL